MGREEFMQIEGGCYPPRLRVERSEITLGDLYNCSHHTKAEFNDCFIMHSKMFLSSYSATTVTGPPRQSCPIRLQENNSTFRESRLSVIISAK